MIEDDRSPAKRDLAAGQVFTTPQPPSPRQAASYLRGLLSGTERKNGWTLGEVPGDAGPETVQRLLNFYVRDADGARDDVRESVVEAIVAPISAC